MALVEVASLWWGTLTDAAGNTLNEGTLASINTTVYTTADGSTVLSPMLFFCDARGRLPGYVDGGDWTLTVGSRSYPAPVLSTALALTRKRVSIPCGAVGSNTVTTIPDLNPRQLVAVPETTVRWRLRIRNYQSANASPTGDGLGVFTITGLGIGTPLNETVTNTSSSGRWAGKTTAAMAATIAAASITNGTEYTSEWITDPAKQLGRVPKVLSLGLRTASGSWRYGGDFLSGVLFYGTGSADAYLAATAGGFSAAVANYFDWRIECEFLTSRLVVLCIGDSIPQGVSGGDGGCFPHEAWPGAAAMRGNFLAINAGVAGSGVGNWNSLSNWHYARFDLATTVPDVAVVALGTNDGYSNTLVPTGYHSIKTLLQGIGINRFIAGLPLQYNYTGGSETTRSNLAAWMRGVPDGYESAFLFDRATADPANRANGDADLMPTPPHPVRGGYMAIAQTVRIDP